MIMQYETKNGDNFIDNIYGWTGGTIGSIPAGRTDDLLTIVFNELELQDPGPAMCCGDINGDPNCFPVLQRKLEAGTWHDVGALQQFTGLQKPRATCRAKVGGRETRRDYIFVNSVCLDIVQSVDTVNVAGIPTHRPVDITTASDLTAPPGKIPQDANTRGRSL